MFCGTKSIFFLLQILYFILRNTISNQLSLNALCIVLSSIYTGQIKYIFQRWNCEFYSGDMSQNLQICTDYSLQRFLQWSSVCSPAIPVVFCREGQDPDNGETLVILHADVTIDKLLQGKMRKISKKNGTYCGKKKRRKQEKL